MTDFGYVSDSFLTVRIKSNRDIVPTDAKLRQLMDQQSKFLTALAKT
jgi:hypothetical protein